MRKQIVFLLITSSLLCSNGLKSNNILVSNASLEGQDFVEKYVFLEFDLSWDNSWRTSSIPQNYDAAWIFAKYRVSGGTWNHMVFRQTDYFAPSGSIIDISQDSVGAMVYRDSDGNGTVSWTNIRFRWDYGLDGVADDALVEVRVFGIEMVYIPQGAFYVGDTSSTGSFHQGNDSKSFFLINSAGSITINNTSSSELWASSDINSGDLPAAYPEGYNAFYCMKYELSQEQYVEFLNTLDRLQQDNRTETDISGTSVTNVNVMSGTASVINRNGIQCNGTLNATGPVTFFCNYNNDGNPNEPDDGQNIACGYLNWQDVAAYLDWAGLRPITELEFEKTCRGPNIPIGYEYAWGSTDICTTAYSLANQGTAVEEVINMELNKGNCLNSLNYGSGSDYGPFRCGIFAASSPNHTRVETGAGYYGVMELSGNVTEFAVNVYNTAGRSYEGDHGNGMVSDSGYADVDHWPGINGNITEANDNGVSGGSIGVTGWAGIGFRGDCFDLYFLQGAISSRINCWANSSPYTIRWYGLSGRGCRTAW